MNVHTIEIFSLLTAFDLRRLTDYLFYLARTNRKCTYRKGGVVHCNYLHTCGILITLKETPIGGSIHLKVNPSEVLGDTRPLTTFVPTCENTDQLISELNERFVGFPICLNASHFSLYRVDLCKDIHAPDRICAEYIRLLRRRQIPQNWKRSCFGDERDRRSFRAGNERYQITAYDKSYQVMKCRDGEGQNNGCHTLRFEVALLRDGILRILKNCEYGVETKQVWTHQLCLLAQNGASIMEKCFNKISSYAPYHTLSEAKEIIGRSSYYCGKQENLVEFLTQINQCKTVDLRLIRSTSNGKKRLEQLAQLGINPITISARAKVAVLPSPQQLISEIAAELDSEPQYASN